MGRRFDFRRGSSPVVGDPSNPYHWALDGDKEEARERLLQHIDAYTERFGADGVPVIGDDFHRQVFALAQAAEALNDDVRELLARVDTLMTPETDDDEFRKMWAYVGADGKTGYAATKQEAIARTKLADLKTVRVAFVVPQSDGTFREISIG